MEQINPEILIWARETAGLTLDEASKKLKFTDTKVITGVKKLERMESGELKPTKRNLEKMAEVYRRPLIVFYLESVPKEKEKLIDFRGKTVGINARYNGLLSALIRDVIVRQDILKDAFVEENEDLEPLHFVGKLNDKFDVEVAADFVVKNLNFNLTIFREKRNKYDAFRYLRDCIEQSGIFVLLIGNLGNYYTNLDTNIFRGFTLFDESVPFIVVNSNDGKGALSFTLLHEVVHIFLGHSSISNGDLHNTVEAFCNNVASEILLSSRELTFFYGTDFENEIILKEKIEAFSEKNNISSSMIVLRLFKEKLISFSQYESLNDYYYLMWNLSERQKKNKAKEGKKGGPNYQILKRSQVGNNLLSLVRYYMANGTFSINTASKVLGVSSNHVISILGDSA